MKIPKFLIVAATAMSLAVGSAHAKSSYVSRVPNGGTFSCSTCHSSVPTLNAFGRDFKNAGKQWTMSLAAVKDSDGDGFTNGQELGDPAGIWTQGGSLPIPGAQVSNPGDNGSTPSLTPPGVSITSPSDGEELAAPFEGEITADVGGPAEGIVSVEFFAGMDSLGVDETPPFAVPVSLPAGTYAITAQAMDYLGASNVSSPITIIVAEAAFPPTITEQPISQTVMVGQNVIFTVVATGTEPLAYQWSKDGTPIPGANAPALELPSVTLADAGGYNVEVGNTEGSTMSDTATLTVQEGAIAPSIAEQPISQTVTVGQNVVFTVVATGTEPLAYQWSKDGTALAGANSPALELPGVTLADAGDYTVEVSNTEGSATSDIATLTVIDEVLPPEILEQPMSQTLLEGQTALFSVTAAGSEPLAYQWSMNGTPIPDATGSVLEIPNITTADAGDYTVEVSNSAGSALSDPATLTVNTASTDLSIQLTKPENGESFEEPANIALKAEVSGAVNHDIVVEFFANGESLGLGVPKLDDDDDWHHSEDMEKEDGEHHEEEEEWEEDGEDGEHHDGEDGKYDDDDDDDDHDGEHHDDDDHDGDDDGDDAWKFSLLWKDVPAGEYSITAVVTDAQGGSAESNTAMILVRMDDESEPPEFEAPKVRIVARDPIARFLGESVEQNTATFVVRRDGAKDTDLTVYYEPSGMALAGADYETLPGTVVIPAGQRSAEIAVVPLRAPDTDHHKGLTVVLMLQSPPVVEPEPPTYRLGKPSRAGAVIKPTRPDKDDDKHEHFKDGLFHFAKPPMDSIGYRVEVSTNLKDWVPVSWDVVRKGEVLHFVDPDADGSTILFYRMVPDNTVPPDED